MSQEKLTHWGQSVQHFILISCVRSSVTEHSALTNVGNIDHCVVLGRAELKLKVVTETIGSVKVLMVFIQIIQTLHVSPLTDNQSDLPSWRNDLSWVLSVMKKLVQLKQAWVKCRTVIQSYAWAGYFEFSLSKKKKHFRIQFILNSCPGNWPLLSQM